MNLLLIFLSIGAFLTHLVAFLFMGLNESFLSEDLGRTTGHLYNLILFWPSAIVSIVGNLCVAGILRKEGKKILTLVCVSFAVLTLGITVYGFSIAKHIYVEAYRPKVKVMSSEDLIKVPIQKRILSSLAGQELIKNRRNDMFLMLDRKEIFTDSQLHTIVFLLAERPDARLVPYLIDVEKRFIDHKYLSWRTPLELLGKYESSIRVAACDEIEKYAISVGADQGVLNGIRYCSVIGK